MSKNTYIIWPGRGNLVGKTLEKALEHLETEAKLEIINIIPTEYAKEKDAYTVTKAIILVNT